MQAKKLSIIGFNFIIYFLVVYFIYHSLNGSRSILAYQKLSKELQNKQNILINLNNEKSYLENKIFLISKDKVDLDILDELARHKLGLVGKKDIVIFLKED